MTRSLRRAGLLSTIALTIGCAPERKADSADPRPSILLFSVDTLSASHLPVYGYPRDTAPRLSRFAEEAIVFDHCLTNASWTTPSYVAQFTGLLPGACFTSGGDFMAKFGRRPHVWERWRVPAARTTLAEMLASVGYRTAAFIDNLAIGPSYGFDAGFEVYDTTAGEVNKRDPEGGIRTILPLATSWLATLADDQPFFLFLNVFDPHGSYIPPQEFEGLFAGDDIVDREHELPVSFMELVGNAVRPHTARSLLALEDDLPPTMRTAPLIDRYDQEIFTVDQGFGRLLDFLRESGRYEDTLVVFSADHGESMVEHEFKFGHGYHVRPVLHVPLLIRLPGGEGAPARVPTTVQLIDLVPTIRELVGLGPGASELHGTSLVPALRGEPLPERPVITQSGAFESNSVTFQGWRLVQTTPSKGRMHAILTHGPGRRWLATNRPEFAGLLYGVDDMRGLIESSDDVKSAMLEVRNALGGTRHALYHVALDPGEQEDVSLREPERLEALLALLQDGLARAAAARAAVPPELQAHELTEDELAELRNLGYVGE